MRWWSLAFVFHVMILPCFLYMICAMPCHDHNVPTMHCFGCCQYYSPCDVSTNDHEETPIVSSYIFGDFDAFHTLHVSHNCFHHMHSTHNNALDISMMHYIIWVSIMIYITTNLSWWMTCFYIMHLIYLSIGYFVLTYTSMCASWWMMCTYTTHTQFSLCLCFV